MAMHTAEAEVLKVGDLEELFEQFIDQVSYMEVKSKSTVRGYTASFDLFVKFVKESFGTIPSLEDLTKTRMIEFFKYLHTRERVVGREIKSGVLASTIGTYRGKLDVFFKWLIKHEHLEVNPFKGIAYPNIRYEDKRYFDKSELNALFNAIDHGIIWANNFVRKRNSAMMVVGVNAGLRKGELLGLEFKDLNFVTRSITVRAETSKSKRIRVIPMSHDATFALKDYLAERSKKNYLTPYLWVSNNYDRGFSEGGLIHLVRVIKEQAGIENFHLHRLRHTFAVNYYKQTKDIVALQNLLGHTDIDMTKKYLRALPVDWSHKDMQTFTLGKAI